MNERIEALIAQTRLRYNTHQSTTERTEELKKFAELIIKECMDICDEVQDQYGQYTFTARICKERFQERFGVE